MAAHQIYFDAASAPSFGLRSRQKASLCFQSDRGGMSRGRGGMRM